MSVLWLLWSLTARAEDCDDWGQVTPEERVVYVGETITLYVVAGNTLACGDVDQCTWSVDDELGTLSATTGSPVDWTAPDTLTDCLPIALRVYVQCPGVATGASEIDLRCTDEELEALRASRGSTVAGGGCGTSGTSAAALLPFVLATSLRRTRSRPSRGPCR